MHELRLNQRLQLVVKQPWATCRCKWPMNFPRTKKKPQIPPAELSSRPERSEWRDLQFLSATHQPSLGAPLPPLSSRPKRSEVEGSAVQQTRLGNVFLQTGVW